MMPRKPKPLHDQRTAMIAARTTQDTKDRVEAAARAEGRTVSDWLLAAVEVALGRTSQVVGLGKGLTRKKRLKPAENQQKHLP